MIAENALVPVGTPNGFLLAGTLTENVINGGLAIIFPATTIIPSFPDPYAAVYSAAVDEGQEVTGISATVAWTPTTAPSVTVRVIDASASAGTTAITTEDVSPFADQSTAVSLAGADRLLDVSTNADQWGLAIASRANQFSFSGLILQAPATDTAVFTTPGISWEPVVDTSSAPGWLSASSPDDGIPTVFLVAATTPAAIVPVTTLEQYQTAAGSALTRTAFTLPFGITAEVNDTRTNPTLSGPTYSVPSIAFPDQGLAGARVLSITAGPPNSPPETTMPGNAICGYSPTSPAYGAQVLDGTPLPVQPPTVANFWDQDFENASGGQHKGVPVARIDLSGYGTSLFSDWRDDDQALLGESGVVRALFNVLLGRTAHETVTAQTWILPVCVPMQRTVTFDRSDGGEVVRHDTGWQPVGLANSSFFRQRNPQRSLSLMGRSSASTTFATFSSRARRCP